MGRAGGGCVARLTVRLGARKRRGPPHGGRIRSPSAGGLFRPACGFKRLGRHCEKGCEPPKDEATTSPARGPATQSVSGRTVSRCTRQNGRRRRADAWMEDVDAGDDDVTMEEVRSQLFDTTSRLAQCTALLQRMVVSLTNIRM